MNSSIGALVVSVMMHLPTGDRRPAEFGWTKSLVLTDSRRATHTALCCRTKIGTLSTSTSEIKDVAVAHSSWPLC